MMNASECREYRARHLEAVLRAVRAEMVEVLEDGEEAPERFLLLGDGHGLYAPEAYTDRGVPQDVVANVTRTHRSDGTPTGTIFGEAGAVRRTEAVYHLEWLTHLARLIGVTDSPQAMGRGRRARQYVQLIVEHLDPNPQGAAPAPEAGA